jgi:hypothetical protein
MGRRAAEVKTIAEAAKPFYASLDEIQKRNFAMLGREMLTAGAAQCGRIQREKPAARGCQRIGIGCNPNRSSSSGAPESNSSATNRRILAILACSWVIIGPVAAAHPKDETSLCADKSSEGDSKPSQVAILGPSRRPTLRHAASARSIRSS